MTKLKSNYEKLVEKQLLEEAHNLKSEKSPVLLSVRQYFYEHKQYQESLIKTLERTYNEQKKSESEWSEIMLFKKIIFWSQFSNG